MASSRIPYVVDKMTLADVPAVAALEQVVFSLPWSVHAFEYELQYNPMAHFLVVRPREPGAIQEKAVSLPRRILRRPRQELAFHVVLGYGGFWLVLDEAHICTLAVHPDWRGRGLGEFLLAHLIDRAMQLNAMVMTLEVRASNLVAQNLYRKYGFVSTGLRKEYYSDNHEDALIMTTDLISLAAFQERFQALKASLWQKLAGS